MVFESRLRIKDGKIFPIFHSGACFLGLNPSGKIFSIA
jgi:hypothetical protein